jgi:hypothetical protein
MARKEMVYVVTKETNLIARASASLVSAFTFAATLASESYYICTSDRQDLKKGQSMLSIADVL